MTTVSVVVIRLLFKFYTHHTIKIISQEMYVSKPKMKSIHYLVIFKAMVYRGIEIEIERYEANIDFTYFFMFNNKNYNNLNIE